MKLSLIWPNLTQELLKRLSMQFKIHVMVPIHGYFVASGTQEHRNQFSPQDCYSMTLPRRPELINVRVTYSVQ